MHLDGFPCKCPEKTWHAAGCKRVGITLRGGDTEQANFKRLMFKGERYSMKNLETNDWLMLNSIIYKIYTVEDVDDMRKQLLEQLKMLLDFDSADFYMAAAGGENHLTRREHTILRLLLGGKTNADICDELTITDNTLKKHILNIYRKLGINNRVQMFKLIKEKE